MRWGRLGQATPVPGSLAFYAYAYADSAGVDIFYVSNRYTEQLPETMANLRHLGYPQVDSAHVLLRTAGGGKATRRARVAATHEVAMLLGDDFSEAFDDEPGERHAALVEEAAASFGTACIVLPNRMCGNWESDGIYGGRRDYTAARRDSVRRSLLRTYEIRAASG